MVRLQLNGVLSWLSFQPCRQTLLQKWKERHNPGETYDLHLLRHILRFSYENYILSDLKYLSKYMYHKYMYWYIYISSFLRHLSCKSHVERYVTSCLILSIDKDLGKKETMCSLTISSAVWYPFFLYLSLTLTCNNNVEYANTSNDTILYSIDWNLLTNIKYIFSV